jgi:hypothetical protein
MATKICQYGNFCFENIPSGNPGARRVASQFGFAISASLKRHGKVRPQCGPLIIGPLKSFASDKSVAAISFLIEYKVVPLKTFQGLCTQF